MTRPCPEAASGARHACTERMVPRRLVPSTSSMSFSVISASGVAGKIPALAQSTSMPPNRSAAAATIRWQSSRRPTSASTWETSAPPADSSATVPLAASASRPTMSTLAPAPANTRAMPLPMPRVAPVTTTARPAMDVNMLAFPFLGALCRADPVSGGPAPGRSAGPASAEAAEVVLGQVAAPGGVSRPELLCDVDRRVRADPGDQQQPAVQDERPDLGLVLGGQVQHPPVAGQPGVDQRGHVRLMLEEAHRRADVVEEPAEPGVVEVDDADRVAVDQQVGQPGVGVHQPVPFRAGAEGGQPGPQRGVEPAEDLPLGGVYSMTRRPPSPPGARAERCVVVPAEPGEAGRALPGPRVPVHPGGDLAQLREVRQRVVGGLGAGQELEPHAVTFL